jgi:hypothetical protein
MKLNADMQQDIIDRLLADMTEFLNTYEVINIKLETKDKDYYGSDIHCSKLGACKRQVVYEYFKFDKKPYSLQTLLNFTRGNMYHELVYQWLAWSKEFKLLEKEVVISEGLPDKISGKLDCIFKDSTTNITILADVKTAASNQFKQYIGSLPKKEHIKQLSSYKVGYDNMKRYTIDAMLMMYFSNGSDRPQFYFVEPDETIFTDFSEYKFAVELYGSYKELPPRLDAVFNDKDAWQCDYCDYQFITCEGLVGEKQNKRSKK